MVLLGSSRQEQAIRPRQVCDQSVAALQGSTEVEVRTLSFEQRPGSIRRVVQQPFANESAPRCFESVVMTNTIDDQVDLVGGRRRVTRPVKPEVLPGGDAAFGTDSGMRVQNHLAHRPDGVHEVALAGSVGTVHQDRRQDRAARRRGAFGQSVPAILSCALPPSDRELMRRPSTPSWRRCWHHLAGSVRGARH